MALIPFILDLADELHEFNRSLAAGMDIDDFGFGIYPHEPPQSATLASQQHHSSHSHYQQQANTISPQRRARLASPLYWVPALFKQRHHPYNRGSSIAKTVCCNKSMLELEKELADKEGTGGGSLNNATGSATSSGTAAKSAYSVVNKNGFQVSMNVKQFAPDELTVKTIDNCIVVEGQHDEKEDGHGVISRHFIRKYMLPKGYDPNDVLSTLSSDGILTVKAPPPTPPAAADERAERNVDIQQTGGPAHLSPVKDAQTPTKEQKQQPKVAAVTTAAVEKEQQLSQPTAAGAAAVVATSTEEHNGDVAANLSAVQAMETSNGSNGETANTATQSADEAEPMQYEITDLTTTTTTKTKTATTTSAAVAAAAAKDAAENSTEAAINETAADANANINANCNNGVAAAAATTVAANATANDNTQQHTIEDVEMTAAAAADAKNANTNANANANANNSTTNINSNTKTNAKTNVEEQLGSVAPQKAAAELIAAADAAILLAKTQVDNPPIVATAAVPVPIPTEEIAN